MRRAAAADQLDLGRRTQRRVHRIASADAGDGTGARQGLVGIERADASPVSLRAIVGGLAGHRNHLVPAHGLRRIVERHVELDDLALRDPELRAA
jgi:hypothetical protein